MLEYDEQYNASFSCWMYSLWPLIKKIYSFCLTAQLFSSFLVRFICTKMQFKTTRSLPPDGFKRFDFSYSEWSFFPFLICLLFFVLRQIGLKRGIIFKRLFASFCFLFLTALLGVLVFVDFGLGSKQTGHFSGSQFSSKFGRGSWFRILLGCWKLAFIFDRNLSYKWNIIPIILVPYCLAFLFIQKATYKRIHPSSETLLLDSLAALNLPFITLVLAIALLVYFPLSLFNKICDVMDEFSKCQEKGILPKTSGQSKKQAHKMEAEDTSQVALDAIYLTQIRRATTKDSQSFRFYLLLAFCISFFFSTNHLCILQGNHFLFDFLVRCYISLKLFWMEQKQTILQKIKKTTVSLTESEVYKAFVEKTTNFCDYVLNFTVGSLAYSYISMFVAPSPFSWHPGPSEVQMLIFYWVFGFSISILVIWPLFVVLFYIRSFEMSSNIPELLIILFIVHIVGCGFVPTIVMLIEVWIGWNLYNRFIYTYCEKKLTDDIS